MPVLDRLKSAWNAFVNTDPRDAPPAPYVGTNSYGGSSPSTSPIRFYSERSIISSVYARMSIDIAGVAIRHVKLDEKKRYSEDSGSSLNTCLTLEPNIDQGPRAFRQDIALTLFDKGVAAIVPVDTTVDPEDETKFDVLSMRVGEVLEWYPEHVRLNVYNDRKGEREEIVLRKRAVAIVENPLYAVMNEPNSTLQRLVRKLGLLDQVDEQSSSGRLDVIIQLPYVVKSEARELQAEKRRDDIEVQLRGSKYGIAYIDGTEKITQLNRPAENNLLKQVEYLTALLYSQLGLTEDVMNGTADEAAMLNYFNRTIEPIVQAVVEGMQRTFLGAARTNQAIKYFSSPFKLAPLKDIAEIADKLCRNEVVASNEIRTELLGLPPSDDPKADQLRNSNMPQQEQSTGEPTPKTDSPERIRQNGS